MLAGHCSGNILADLGHLTNLQQLTWLASYNYCRYSYGRGTGPTLLLENQVRQAVTQHGGAQALCIRHCVMNHYS